MGNSKCNPLSRIEARKRLPEQRALADQGTGKQMRMLVCGGLKRFGLAIVPGGDGGHFVEQSRLYASQGQEQTILNSTGTR